MLLSSDTEHHVRSGLQEAISLFCKAGFKFDVELSIDGLLAVTLDQKEVFLFNIKEIIRPDDMTAKNISCLAEHQTDDSCLALSPSPSVASGCGSKSDLTCDANINASISGPRSDDSASHLDAGVKSESSVCKNSLHQQINQEHDISENMCSSSASSFPTSLENKKLLPCCSTESEVDDNQDVAEDLSLKENERSSSCQFSSDACKIEVDVDASSSNDQYLTGLLQNGDRFLQHIKQEPEGVANGIDDSGLPYMASLSTIRQRLGIMSQYIGMSQVVAGLHPGFMSPPRTYPWSEQVLSPRASAGPVSQLANQLNISSSSTPVSVGSAVRRPKMSLNIPSVRTSGRHGGFKSSPFLSPERNICANCGAGRTTVWRRTEDKQILCNACGCYFKLHKVHRPLSMVRHEIRSRCRRPKNLSYSGGGMKYASRELEQSPSSDAALNLKVSPPFTAESKNQL